MDQSSSNTHGLAPTDMPNFSDSLISATFASPAELTVLTHVLYNSSSVNVARLRYLLNQDVERRRSTLIQYRDSLGASPDVGLDRVAYDLLHYGVSELECAGRGDFARLLLQRTAPKGFNTVDAWFDAFAVENWGIDGHPSRWEGATQLGETDVNSRMVPGESQPSFTDNLDPTNTSHPPLPSFTSNVDTAHVFHPSQPSIGLTTSSHHQSFLNTDNTENMGKSTRKSTSTKKSSSASAGNPPPAAASPTSLDAAPAVTPVVAPARASARLSARQQTPSENRQEQQQQVVPAPPPPQLSKRAKTSAKKNTATAPKKTRYHPGHQMKFPPTAPIHHRFLCPYNRKPAKGKKPCLSYFSKRYDLTRYVMAKHHKGARGFGAKEKDFYGCGPFTVNELRRRGVTEVIVARKSMKGEKRVLAGAMGPKVKAERAMGEPADGNQTESEDEDADEGEGEDEEMDDEEDEYLSDGDDKADRDPPQGRKDDGNDGNGDGHASASLIAVA